MSRLRNAYRAACLYLRNAPPGYQLVLVMGKLPGKRAAIHVLGLPRCEEIEQELRTLGCRFRRLKPKGCYL